MLPSEHLTRRKALREYATTFIVQPEISEEGNTDLLTRLDGVLASGSAKRLMCEDHGKRKLAYEINKFHKGHYYTLMFLDEGQVVPDLERVFGLTGGNIFHGAMTLDRLLFLRPLPGWSHYRTPIDGL